MVVEDLRKEELVASWLRTHGYFRVTVSDESIIEADGKMRRMVVGVRTPETRDFDTEKIQIVANSKHREPWIAIVEPDNHIVWYTVK